ncbi:hypothetical protein PT974_11291 [Cladobotryum mycophilum]|uniref:Uncharacterized protein n=1 Tax=Cladobotryum mycophilum TaxID=491253 RepID=A0ABR0S4T4_9HYPO
MPRLYGLFNRADPVAEEQQKHSARKEDVQLGTGPEKFAPWWPLLEEANRNNNLPHDAESERLPLTEENLNFVNERTNWKKRKVSFPWESSVEDSHPDSALSHSAAEFPFKLYQNGVLGPVHSKPPSNLKDLEKVLKCKPPEYTCYKKNLSAAKNPETLVWEILWLMWRFPTSPEYRTATCRDFDMIPLRAPFNAGLSVPCPDFVQGIEVHEFDSVRIEYIPGAVLFKNHTQSIALAHIAGEFYGISQSQETAQIHNAHAGAALVYARNHALEHIAYPDNEGESFIFTFTTDGATINFFAHYATKSDDGAVQYHQYPITSTNLGTSYTEFKKGWTQLHNCQQHAYDISHELKSLLHTHHVERGATSWACEANHAAPGDDARLTSDAGGIKHKLAKETIEALGDKKGDEEVPEGGVYNYVAEEESDANETVPTRRVQPRRRGRPKRQQAVSTEPLNATAIKKEVVEAKKPAPRKRRKRL